MKQSRCKSILFKTFCFSGVLYLAVFLTFILPVYGRTYDRRIAAEDSREQNRENPTAKLNIKAGIAIDIEDAKTAGDKKTKNELNTVTIDKDTFEKRTLRADEVGPNASDHTKDKRTAGDGVNGKPMLEAALPGAKALVLYDAPQGVAFSKFGRIFAIMLRNLLGHFQLEVDLAPVENYLAGDVEQYEALFYLGSYYDNALPAAFLSDVVATEKTVVWFKYNIWKLAWDSAYNFNEHFGFAFNGMAGFNAWPSAENPEPGFFDTVLYKNKALQKYYAYDANTATVSADPDVGWTEILDAEKAQMVVPVENSVTQEQIPYIVRSGNFWYVADLPLSYIGPRDRYLVLCDILHDMLDVDHVEQHKAMVRFEDVAAFVDLNSFRTLSNYMAAQTIPFSVAVIPVYMDPLGKYNGGVSQEIHLAEADTLRSAMDYALTRGGDIVMHGVTHQYGETLNPHSGVSADDFEFWNAVANSPVAEDSLNWASTRISSGYNEFTASGYTPFTFETPHYQGSPNSYAASSQLFGSRYGRAYYYTATDPQLNLAAGSPDRDFSAGQFFPYVIYSDYYGQTILPENLGNIEYDISYIDPISNIDYGWEELAANAEHALLIRDGYASFFFHPFWMESELGTPGFSDFQNLVNAITDLGFSWVGAKTELDSAAP